MPENRRPRAAQMPRGLPGECAAARHRVTLPVDSGAKPILLSATMKTALILVVGKRVGKAV
jgi:hypothetical protein